MLDCLDIARYFIIRAYEDGREAEMTNMKVQKLLYYAQSLHLALYDEPLFGDEMQAWRYGPVCPPAYRYYSEFEASQLPVPGRPELAVISEAEQQLAEEVWDYFGIHHAYILSSMTHLEFPWRKARRGLPENARSTEPIQIKDMQLLGEKKLAEIEREHPAYAPIMAHVLEQAFSTQVQPEYVKQGEVRGWLNSLLD